MQFSQHRLSKLQIAEKLSELLGEPVSLSRLDSYTASTKVSARLPAYFLRALCEVLDSDEILLFLARPCLRKQAEFAERVRELRQTCDELLNLQGCVDRKSANRQKPATVGVPGDLAKGRKPRRPKRD
jgi:hypothetical protein